MKFDFHFLGPMATQIVTINKKLIVVLFYKDQCSLKDWVREKVVFAAVGPSDSLTDETLRNRWLGTAKKSLWITLKFLLIWKIIINIS